MYRAIDQYGQVIDVLVSARRFVTRALTTLKAVPVEVVTTRPTRLRLAAAFTELAKAI